MSTQYINLSIDVVGLQEVVDMANQGESFQAEVNPNYV